MRHARIIAIATTLLGLLIVVALTRGQSASNANTSMPGRYKLVAATVQGQDSLNAPVTAEPHMFMVNTITGEVWHYVPSGPFRTPKGNPGFTPDMFRRVLPVEGLEGSIPESMQKAIEYFDKNPATPINPKH